MNHRNVDAGAPARAFDFAFDFLTEAKHNSKIAGEGARIHFALNCLH